MIDVIQSITIFINKKYKVNNIKSKKILQEFSLKINSNILNVTFSKYFNKED